MADTPHFLTTTALSPARLLHLCKAKAALGGFRPHSPAISLPHGCIPPPAIWPGQGRASLSFLAVSTGRQSHRTGQELTLSQTAQDRLSWPVDLC